jgi:pimeloyl-ACP methyl ester carboxylesterase
MILPSPYAARLDAIPLERRTEELAGSATELWVYGPHDADTTIVLVHGFRGDHHGLEPVVAHLPRYRTIVADLPGFGASTPLAADHDIVSASHTSPRRFGWWSPKSAPATCMRARIVPTLAACALSGAR